MVISEPKVLRLERDGVVNLELRHVFENCWDGVLAEVPRKGVRNISEHEGNVAGQWLWEDGGQSGQYVVYADGAARDGAIEEDENSIDRVDVVIDLSCNTLPVELVLLKTASVDQPRSVENANLEKRLRVFHVHKHQHVLLYCCCS